MPVYYSVCARAGSHLKNDASCPLAYSRLVLRALSPRGVHALVIWRGIELVNWLVLYRQKCLYLKDDSSCIIVLLHVDLSTPNPRDNKQQAALCRLLLCRYRFDHAGYGSLNAVRKSLTLTS
jgi:hypothetical protein